MKGCISRFLIMVIGTGVLVTSAYLRATRERPAEDGQPTASVVPQTSETLNEADDLAMLINQEDGIAIAGTDPVAYFTENAPQQGNAEFQISWQGATWYFASAENRDLFAANPEQYAPQYGGYCAWAISQGYLAEIDPNAWTIVDDRLYLNFNQSIRKRWEDNRDQFIVEANRRWPILVQENSLPQT